MIARSMTLKICHKCSVNHIMVFLGPFRSIELYLIILLSVVCISEDKYDDELW